MNESLTASPKVAKPKKGDAVSVRNSGFSLVSYEGYTVERVRLDKVWLDGLDHPFEFPSGRYLMPPGFDLGLRVSVLFDGGKMFREHGND